MSNPSNIKPLRHNFLKYIEANNALLFTSYEPLQVNDGNDALSVGVHHRKLYFCKKVKY